MEDLVTKHSQVLKVSADSNLYGTTTGKAHAKVTLQHTIKTIELMSVGTDGNSRRYINNFLGSLHKELKELQ